MRYKHSAYICTNRNKQSKGIMKNITSIEEFEVQTRHYFSDTHKIAVVRYIDEEGRNTQTELNLSSEMDRELYDTYKFLFKLQKK